MSRPVFYSLVVVLLAGYPLTAQMSSPVAPVWLDQTALPYSPVPTAEPTFHEYLIVGPEAQPNPSVTYIHCEVEEPSIPQRLRGRVDYLMWWVPDAPQGASLVTTGPTSEGAFFGQAGTRVLYGNEGQDFGTLSGARLQLGYILDPESELGVDVEYFFLGRKTDTVTITSSADGAPQLARPFQNATTGNQTSVAISFPGTIAGSMAITNALRFQGWGAGLSGLAFEREGWRCTWSAGYRGLTLRETLGAVETFRPLQTGVLSVAGVAVDPPSQIVVLDEFQTANYFHGVGIGGSLSWVGEVLSLEGTARLNMGPNVARLVVTGSSAAIGPTQQQIVAPGGVLALPTNIGTFRSVNLAVVPEVGLNLGIALTPWLMLRTGYQYMYWSRVIRPGDQTDRLVADTLIPTSQFYGPTGRERSPQAILQRTDFHAHGLNFGLEVRY